MDSHSEKEQFLNWISQHTPAHWDSTSELDAIKEIRSVDHDNHQRKDAYGNRHWAPCTCFESWTSPYSGKIYEHSNLKKLDNGYYGIILLFFHN